MTSHFSALLARAVLTLHVGIILFNLFGMTAVPLGALYGWRFVRVFWWRALHIVIIAGVAVQAIAGRACILTIWQSALLGSTATRTPLIMRWVDRLVFWPLPVWVFAAAYVTVLLYVVALLWLVPPRWPIQAPRRGTS